MAERKVFNQIKENSATWRIQGILLLASIALLTSCNFLPQTTEKIPPEIATLVKKACSSQEIDNCRAEVISRLSDLYKYHCVGLVFNSKDQLQIGELTIQPEENGCPEGTFLLTPQEIDGICLILLDDGAVNGEYDYDDTVLDGVCVEN